MRTLALLLFAISFFRGASNSVAGAAQVAADGKTQSPPVIQAILDYVEGVQAADADRLAGAVHPEVTSVVLASYPQTGKVYLRKAHASQIIEVTRGGGGYLEQSQRDNEVVVHDIDDGMAVASVHSSRMIRYLQLGKADGSWKVINALSVPVRDGSGAVAHAADTAAARSAIARTALDYIDGSFSGDAARMARALHPEITKILLTEHPRTGKQFLVTTGASDLIEGTRAQLGLMEDAKRNIEVTVYEVGSDIACAKIVSAVYIDHLQLARIEGAWKIVNVLWVPNPAFSEG